MAGTNKPDRVGAKYVKNYEGNAKAPQGQRGSVSRQSANNSKNVGGSDMAQPNNAPQRAAGVTAGKAAYKRSHVGVTPEGLPMKRQPEGSVLTGGSATKGAVQPHSRGGAQNMSKLKKGAD